MRIRTDAFGRGSALVLLYHRITTVDSDPLSLCVAPQRFEAHVDHLARTVDVVPISHLRERHAERRVVVTFDDGYADNLRVALPILEAAAIPATFFIVSGICRKIREFWWDRLQRLFAAPSKDFILVDLETRRVRLDMRNAAARERGLRLLNNALYDAARGEIDRVLDAIETQLEGPSTPSPDLLDVEEVRELDDREFATVGAHTRTHPMLSNLDRRAQRDEIVGSRAELEAVVGHSVDVFAYPFGTASSFDRTTQRTARKAGFEFACATTPGLTNPRTNSMRIPRLTVSDWGVEELAERLERAFASGVVEE